MHSVTGTRKLIACPSITTLSPTCRYLIVFENMVKVSCFSKNAQRHGCFSSSQWLIMTYNQISSKQNCKTSFRLPLRCVWRTRGLWPVYVLMFSLKCVKGYFCGLTYIPWNAYWVPSPQCDCLWRWLLESKVQWGRGMESWVNGIDEERDQESTLWARRGFNRTQPHSLSPRLPTSRTEGSSHYWLHPATYEHLKLVLKKLLSYWPCFISLHVCSLLPGAQTVVPLCMPSIQHTVLKRSENSINICWLDQIDSLSLLLYSSLSSI